MNWNWKTILLLPVLAVALMGQACPDQDAKVRSVLASTCPAVGVAYEHYVAIKTLVSERTQARVELAKQQVDRICANPGSATTITVLASASAAYLAVRSALAEARVSTSSAYHIRHINALERITNDASNLARR